MTPDIVLRLRLAAPFQDPELNTDRETMKFAADLIEALMWVYSDAQEHRDRRRPNVPCGSCAIKFKRVERLLSSENSRK